MGCVDTKHELQNYDCTDIHPNVFRVANIDDAGVDVWSGLLEVTESELRLFRGSHDPTVWPLSALRWYNVNKDIFSIESGRRCTTGEGIYAFRCRRAETLIRALRQNIQTGNFRHNTMPFVLPPSAHFGSFQTLPRPTVQDNVVHPPSLDNGPASSVRTSRNSNSHLSAQAAAPQISNPRSQSSSDIQVMPISTQLQNNTVTKNISSKEHNNTQQGNATNPQHQYSDDLDRDLAYLRTTLHKETILNNRRDIEDDKQFLRLQYVNRTEAVSSTMSSTSDNYAQLVIEQGRPRYMNIIAGNEALSTICDPVPSTSNLAIATLSYAGLEMGRTQGAGKQRPKSSSARYRRSPVEDVELNYVELDKDTSREERVGSCVMVSPESQCADSSTSHASAQSRRHPLDSSRGSATPLPVVSTGYSTIDFERTEALTSLTDDVNFSRNLRHGSSGGISPDEPRA